MPKTILRIRGFGNLTVILPRKTVTLDAPPIKERRDKVSDSIVTDTVVSPTRKEAFSPPKSEGLDKTTAAVKLSETPQPESPRPPRQSTSEPVSFAAAKNLLRFILNRRGFSGIKKDRTVVEYVQRLTEKARQENRDQIEAIEAWLRECVTINDFGIRVKIGGKFIFMPYDSLARPISAAQVSEDASHPAMTDELKLEKARALVAEAPGAETQETPADHKLPNIKSAFGFQDAELKKLMDNNIRTVDRLSAIPAGVIHIITGMETARIDELKATAKKLMGQWASEAANSRTSKIVQEAITTMPPQPELPASPIIISREETAPPVSEEAQPSAATPVYPDLAHCKVDSAKTRKMLSLKVAETAMLVQKGNVNLADILKGNAGEFSTEADFSLKRASNIIEKIKEFARTEVNLSIDNVKTLTLEEIAKFRELGIETVYQLLESLKGDEQMLQASEATGIDANRIEQIKEECLFYLADFGLSEGWHKTNGDI